MSYNHLPRSGERIVRRGAWKWIVSEPIPPPRFFEHHLQHLRVFGQDHRDQPEVVPDKVLPGHVRRIPHESTPRHTGFANVTPEIFQGVFSTRRVLSLRPFYFGKRDAIASKTHKLVVFHGQGPNSGAKKSIVSSKKTTGSPAASRLHVLLVGLSGHVLLVGLPKPLGEQCVGTHHRLRQSHLLTEPRQLTCC